jgi:hypothetical protein
MNNCPHCQQPVFRRSDSGGKVKLGRSAVVLHKSGDIEVNCPRCRRGIVLGRLDSVLMRKAAPRLVVRPKRHDA